MTRAFWVYDCPSPQAILSTDAANALPVEEIIKVRIDRYFYEREVARRANPDHCQSRQLDEPDSPLPWLPASDDSGPKIGMGSRKLGNRYRCGQALIRCLL